MGKRPLAADIEYGDLGSLFKPSVATWRRALPLWEKRALAADIEYSIYATPCICQPLCFRKKLPPQADGPRVASSVTSSDDDSAADEIFDIIAPKVVAILRRRRAHIGDIMAEIGGKCTDTRCVVMAMVAAGTIIENEDSTFALRKKIR